MLYATTNIATNAVIAPVNAIVDADAPAINLLKLANILLFSYIQYFIVFHEADLLERVCHGGQNWVLHQADGF